MSAGVSSDDTPRNVFNVRCASGVTAITQRPVGIPSTDAPRTNSTPMELISRANSSPNASFETLPMKSALPPSEAIPLIVLAADPPLVCTVSPSDSWICNARSASMRDIVPFSMPCVSRNESGTWASMSTRALPTATTSWMVSLNDMDTHASWQR